ncbi:MAG: hypothetical protein LBP78_04705 [Acidaminococcales bacterium]|nr:hypothetical protein [Acidaminococcales bacterium]
MFAAKISDSGRVRALSFTGAAAMALMYGRALCRLAGKNGAGCLPIAGAFLNIWLEAAATFPVAKFSPQPAAVEKLEKFLRCFGIAKPLPALFDITLCAACLRLPLLALFITVWRSGPETVSLPWPAKLAAGFPFALCLPLFCAGLVRRAGFGFFARRWPPKECAG